ncbi:MAG: GNAT family N-acetyltransferase [Coprothermobacterota bacterium]|nr:GNAT family N-acetyltransferase [Coprothermobacterota bacterium]
MESRSRPYQTEDDFWRMREFLRHAFLLNNRLMHSWHVARLDYARWHTCLNCAKVPLQEVVTLWETNGQLTAILMPDGGRGEAHLLVHPTLRTPELEEEMLTVAEQRLASVQPDGSAKLCVWAPEADPLRQQLLVQRGYAKEGRPEIQWRHRLDAPIPEVPVTAGYTIRALGDGLELLERCYASGLGFHEGDIRIAVENREDPTWYHNIQTAPSYRRDLDLVAIASDGEIAAFCTIWFDDVTRSAIFEPVATVPRHQRLGLGRSIMTEGLRRLQRLGATLAFVSGYSPAANALYQSVIGPNHELYEPWVRRWQEPAVPPPHG